MKVALVFPGQGSQYVGMCKDIYEKYDKAKEVVDKACRALNIDIKSIMFDGLDEELSKTENTQPAILIHSIAILETLKEKISLNYSACAGLSLGEYSALVAGGVLDFEEAVKLVKKRGIYMQEAVPMGKGAMAAILGMEREALLNVLKDCSKFGIVESANFNSPGQIVISGEIDAVKKASEICKEKGAKKAVLLNVSGPFHSSMLIKASEKLSKELENINLYEPNVDIISNVTADYVNTQNIKDNLIKQVSSCVLWEDSIDKLLSDGYNTFIEIGPGKTLKAFIKKIATKNKKDVQIYNIDDVDSLDEFIKKSDF